MSKSTRFVGLDDSKDSIEVAVAESGREGEVRRFGLISNTPAALRKLVRQLGRLKYASELSGATAEPIYLIHSVLRSGISPS